MTILRFDDAPVFDLSGCGSEASRLRPEERERR
jgi:hypothetical protein